MSQVISDSVIRMARSMVVPDSRAWEPTDLKESSQKEASTTRQSHRREETSSRIHDSLVWAIRATSSPTRWPSSMFVWTLWAGTTSKRSRPSSIVFKRTSTSATNASRSMQITVSTWPTRSRTTFAVSLTSGSTYTITSWTWPNRRLINWLKMTATSLWC